MAMKKKAAPKKAAPKKNSTGGDQPVRAGVGKERANYIKRYQEMYPKDSAAYNRRYGKALKEVASEYGFDRSAGPNRTPKLRGYVNVEEDGSMYAYPKNLPTRNDLAGRRGTVKSGTSRFIRKGDSERYASGEGTVRGRTAQRGIDQAKRRKAANAKKVAKGKK